jgi:hypothetical protein
MPAVYNSWLRYRERGYDVHIFYLDEAAENAAELSYHGCKIHVIPWSPFLRWFSRQRYLTMRFVPKCLALYSAAKQAGDSAPPEVVYSLQPGVSPAAWALGKRYGALVVKRLFGTGSGHDEFFHNNSLFRKLSFLPSRVQWGWPCDLAVMTDDGSGGERFARAMGIPRKKIRVWANGIDKSWNPSPERAAVLRERLALTNQDFVLMCLPSSKRSRPRGLFWWARDP